MVFKEIDFLLDIETERLLRKQSRVVDLPKSGRQTVDAYALVWQWYDLILDYRHSAGEERIKQNWQACMEQEGLSASDALVRLVYVYVERAERVGLSLLENDVALSLAQKHQAEWRRRRALRQSSSG